MTAVKVQPPKLLSYCARTYPRETVLLGVLMFVYSLMEGLGIATLLPLLEGILGEAEDPSSVSRYAMAAVAAVGLPDTAATYLVIFLVFILLKSVFFMSVLWKIGIVAGQVSMDLRLSLLDSLASAQWSHVRSYPKGFLSNALSAEADRTSMAYREVVAGLGQVVLAFFYGLLVFAISWQTAVLALVTGGTIAAALHGLIRAARRAADQQTESRRELIRRLTDALPSMKSLKAMAREPYLLPLLARDVTGFFHAQRLGARYWASLNAFQEPILAGFLALGLWAVMSFDLLPLSSLLVLFALFYRMVQTLSRAQRQYAQILVGESAFQSLMTHIEAAKALRETWTGDAQPPEQLEEGVFFKDVSFSYGEEPVLTDVDGLFPAGEFIALTGPSGAGKTTAIDLVMGLLVPGSGQVLVDGLDLNDLDIMAWRRGIGYVPQEIMLFSDTVRNNVTLGDDTIPDERMWKALEGAGIAEFVRGLPDGPDTLVGEQGTGLSGGQRQRLAIARALVSDPRILILDEPTTALDSVSEQAVCDTLSGLKGQMTILAVSHQPAIAKIADRVLALSNHKISGLPEGVAA